MNLFYMQFVIYFRYLMDAIIGYIWNLLSNFDYLFYRI